MSSEQQPLQVVLCWHMHQPDYRGPDHSDFQLPWVYLHGIKDYVDMAAHLENIPGARAVVNFSPVLLEQIDEYEEQIEEWLQHGVRIKDPLLAALAGPGLPLEPSLRHDLIKSCLRANEKRLIKRFPAYRRLVDMASWIDKHEESLLYLNDQYLVDLMVWYHLAWMGEFPRKNDLRLHSLEKKGCNYTVEDRRQLVTTIGELLSSIVPRYRRLAEEGKVELSVTPYAHPIIPLLLDMKSAREAMPDIELPQARYYSGGEARSRWHIRRGIDSFKKYFSMAPAGCWPSEGAVSSETMRIMEEEGFDWVASGQQVLVNSLNLTLDGAELPANCVHTPYRVGHGDLNCFFRDDGLSDFIGFTYADWHADDAVGDFINHLEIVADASVGHPDRVVSIIMDGENAWESYPKNGSYFLTALYQRIASHPRLELTTFSDCLKRQQKSAPVLQELVAGSWVYGTFSTWIGDRDKNRAWDMLADAKLVYDRVMASGSLDDARVEEASMQLANCEGSDWFWWFGDYNPGGTVSDFERLFSPSADKSIQSIGRRAPRVSFPRVCLWCWRSGYGRGNETEQLIPRIEWIHQLQTGAWIGAEQGVLLHITSLPGNAATGDMGSEAYRFVDFLAAAGFTVWQTLPLSPPQHDLSPYQARSVHAGNRRLIAIAPLVEKGWIEPLAMKRYCISYECKQQCLLGAWAGFEKLATEEEKKKLADFIGEQRFWLDDYALFEALHMEHHCGWWGWPEGLRDRHPQALAEARSRLFEEIEYFYFEQYLFFTQWHELKQYANERGIQLFGDMPIFVAQDSAEVWAKRGNFLLDQQGKPTVVAGVPPDYFAETGQRWGNPLYNWEVMEKDGFSFWIERIQTQLDMFDMVRIDHFRGFEACWEIPAEDDTAVNGRWVSGPGDALFERLHQIYDSLPLVAEDLGVITAGVDALRDSFGLPGMKVLQFAFNGDSENPHLPSRYLQNTVVYTGTHDNDTTLGWYRALDDHSRNFVDEYLGYSQEPMPWPLIRTALASPAKLAMLPLQDILGLDGTHRMNTPGTTEGNWGWRFEWQQVKDDLDVKLRRSLEIYGRLVE